ncbi:MAG TPA: hypothetical protein DDY58_10170 [Terrisporobacter glycolicus]|uniref:hypothetical protein n=1 Tax=Terrisporobacter TaxID=1505652 RepID=UPI000E9D2E3B|nr:MULTISPECIES: hypothetical protein [Terrisporobacter]HBI92756.1 hypothetical protein [Terrisporobacter hibernicus]
MSGKTRQLVRMSNLLEKSKHVNIEAIEDPTLINYLRLAECILDTNSNHKMSYYLQGLENAEESDKRIQQIDNDRKKGILTESQMIKVNEVNNKYDDIVRRKIEQYKNKQNNQTLNLRPVKVINEYAGITEVYSCIKEFCEEYGYKAQNIVNHFRYYESDQIQYKGLTIQRIK